MNGTDRQRGRVYEAESVVHGLVDRRTQFPVVEAYGSRLVVPDDRKFGDIDSVQRYVDAVLALDWVRRLSPVRSALPVRVRARAGATKAEYEMSTNTIAVPTHRFGGRWAMRELVVLHELAHHLSGGADHGAEFVTVLLCLVEELVGAEAGFLLRSALLDAGASVASG